MSATRLSRDEAAKRRHCAYGDHDRVPHPGRDHRPQTSRAVASCCVPPQGNDRSSDRCQSIGLVSDVTAHSSDSSASALRLSSVSCNRSEERLPTEKLAAAGLGSAFEADLATGRPTLVEDRRRSRTDERAEPGSLPRRNSLGSSCMSRSRARALDQQPRNGASLCTPGPSTAVHKGPRIRPRKLSATRRNVSLQVRPSS